MQRFFIEQRLEGAGQALALPAPVARQLTTVLRKRAGDQVALFNQGGPEWLAELVDVGRSTVTARLVASRTMVPEPARRLTLHTALLKGDKLEWVFQKGTELGVVAFQPLLTERVVAKRHDVPERWRRIVMEAAEQCERVIVPEVREPVAFGDAIAGLSGEAQTLFCWEEERAQHITKVLERTVAQEVHLFIGPEGGFAAQEAELAKQAGAEVVTLGPRVLRADTAAIAASTLVLLTP
jgi:16S rRNA (uracil1498-N3)-methyltransferase